MKGEEEEEKQPAIVPKEKVLLDVDPSKLQKKDHIFMDFFSMYGKNFIESKKKGPAPKDVFKTQFSSKNKNKQITGNTAPFYQFY